MSGPDGTGETPLKASPAGLLARLPQAPTPRWPDGAPFVEAFRHGTMMAEIFAPREVDRQGPHDQDELYVVLSGTGTFVRGAASVPFAPGDVLFVPAGEAHRFEAFSDDFATWVVFWGPPGGEAG